MNLQPGSAKPTSVPSTWWTSQTSSKWHKTSAPNFGGASNFLTDIFELMGSAPEVQTKVEAQLNVVGCVLASQQAVRSILNCSQVLSAAHDHFTSSLAESIQSVASKPNENKCFNRWLSWDDASGNIPSSCSRGMLLQMRLGPKTVARWAYLSEKFGLPARDLGELGDFVKDYMLIKNTPAGDSKQARVFLSRSFMEADPPQIAIHHPMVSNPSLMDAVSAMANEIVQLLSTGSG
ncbi:CHR12 [Symbiodinium pilosum]|uniref:CHR12 protein n=1 Tax=Symbiodinium pilosum TaxID=2952 RepID=A0A812TLJ5_SYMPI|nr:CHR12 [Symbiodinium pilosum]